MSTLDKAFIRAYSKEPKTQAAHYSTQPPANQHPHHQASQQQSLASSGMYAEGAMYRLDEGHVDPVPAEAYPNHAAPNDLPYGTPYNGPLPLQATPVQPPSFQQTPAAPQAQQHGMAPATEDFDLQPPAPAGQASFADHVAAAAAQYPLPAMLQSPPAEPLQVMPTRREPPAEPTPVEVQPIEPSPVSVPEVTPPTTQPAVEVRPIVKTPPAAEKPAVVKPPVEAPVATTPVAESPITAVAVPEVPKTEAPEPVHVNEPVMDAAQADEPEPVDPPVDETPPPVADATHETNDETETEDAAEKLESAHREHDRQVLEAAAALRMPPVMELPSVFQSLAQDAEIASTEFSPDWEVDRFSWPEICNKLLSAEAKYFQQVGGAFAPLPRTNLKY